MLAWIYAKICWQMMYILEIQAFFTFKLFVRITCFNCIFMSSVCLLQAEFFRKSVPKNVVKISCKKLSNIWHYRWPSHSCGESCTIGQKRQRKNGEEIKTRNGKIQSFNPDISCYKLLPKFLPLLVWDQFLNRSCFPKEHPPEHVTCEYTCFPQNIIL